MDLWSLAAKGLSDKNKKTLDFGTTVDLQDLLSSVKGSEDECERKQLVVYNVVLRDIFSKIAVWIQKFMEVGDIAVQYDPGHAALPWAAVRFVLKVCPNPYYGVSLLEARFPNIDNCLLSEDGGGQKLQ